MHPLILVMAGGAVGAGFRYHIGTVALGNMGPGFPWGTWIVNLVGGLMMGVLAGTIGRWTDIDTEPLRLFVGVGILGGFTTFSAFSLEMTTMLSRGETTMAAAYAVSSVAGSVLLLFVGLTLARAMA
jgi:fluoride exporter